MTATRIERNERIAEAMILFAEENGVENCLYHWNHIEEAFYEEGNEHARTMGLGHINYGDADAIADIVNSHFGYWA